MRVAGHWGRAWVAILALGLGLGLRAPAFADGVADEADLQFQMGAEAYSLKRYPEALSHFLASNRLAPNHNVMFNIARAYEKLNKLPEAYRYYVDAARAPTPQLAADAKLALARLAAQIAVIHVRSTPPGATVYLERRDLGSVGTTPMLLGVAAGRYVLRVEHPGFLPYTATEVTGTLGQTTELNITLVERTGLVRLQGHPGAEVRIDAPQAPVRCRVPCTLELGLGPHVAYFSAPGQVAAPLPFDVVDTQPLTLASNLVAATGRLSLDANELGAEVELDGQRRGTTPLTLSEVPVGQHRLRVTLAGYEAYETTFRLDANATYRNESIRLAPTRAIAAASRDEEPIDEAPASVSVISAKELQAFGYPTVLEALRGVRGFAVNYDSLYGNASVRGLGQANDFSNRLLLLQDGAVLNENILWQPFTHYDGRVDLGDLDHVEIVRGPVSALYGTGAVSGVVNLVTRRSLPPSGLAFEGVLASQGHGVARVRLRGEAGSARRGVFASVALAKGHGRTEFLDIPAEPTPVRVHDFDRFAAATTTGRAWWRNTNLQWFYTMRDVTVPTAPFAARLGDPRNHADDRRWMLELTHAWQPAEAWRLTSRLQLNRARYSSQLWYDTEFAPDDPAPLTSYPYDEVYRGLWGTAEGRVRFQPRAGLELTAALEVQHHVRAEMQATETLPDDAPATLLALNAPYSIWAGSLLAKARLHPKLRLLAGLRYDAWMVTKPIDAPADMGVMAWSPRVAVVAKPRAGHISKLLFGSAFRAPSVYERYFGDGKQQVPSHYEGRSLAPERVYSLEYEHTYAAAPYWSVLTSLHGLLARGFIETVPISEATPDVYMYANARDYQSSLGVDLEVQRAWHYGWMASAQAGYLRSVRHGTSAGAQVANAPTFFASAKLIMPLMRTNQLALRAAYEDARPLATLDAHSQRGLIADIVVSGPLPHHLRWQLGGYNVFDWPLSLPGIPYASPVIPQGGRSWLLSLTYAN